MRQGRGAGLRQLAMVLGVSAALMLTGCSSFFTPVNNTPGSGTSSFVYVTNSAGTLAEYSLTSGVLAALSGSPITLPEPPTAIAMAPNDLFLYVGTADGVFLYTINSDGTLTEGNDDTVVYVNQSGLQVASMTVDATSSWLIMAYQNSAEIDALPIAPASGLAATTTVYTANLSSQTLAPRITLSPANTYLFAALGAAGTEGIVFTPTATGTPFATTGTGIPVKTSSSAATAVAVDPTSTYLYITEANVPANSSTTPSAGILRMFKIASLGAELAGSPYATGVGPSAVLPDKSSAYVYVTNSIDGTISGYTVDTTSSTLTALTSTMPTEKSPIAIVEDTSKTYVLDVGNGANPNLWLYSFDGTSLGTLDVGTTTSTSTTNPAAANGIAVTF